MYVDIVKTFIVSNRTDDCVAAKHSKPIYAQVPNVHTFDKSLAGWLSRESVTPCHPLQSNKRPFSSSSFFSSAYNLAEQPQANKIIEKRAPRVWTTNSCTVAHKSRDIRAQLCVYGCVHYSEHHQTDEWTICSVVRPDHTHKHDKTPRIHYGRPVTYIRL